MHALPIKLHRDYEEVSRLGLRRYPADARHRRMVDALVDAGLGMIENGYLTLQRPEYGSVDFPPESLAILQSHYEQWLHAEGLVTGEQVLYGYNGFWQHWWNLLHERGSAPLRMDLVVPDLPELDTTDWSSEIESELLHHVLSTGTVQIRLLLPPRDAEGPLHELARFVAGEGVDVRVRSSPFLFAVYNRSAAVLSAAEPDSKEESYFLTRRSSIVAPLQRVFDDHWVSALPWESYARGAAEVLSLMSLGWTDARIAEALGLSMRTVSRRVSEAMSAAGVASRFELGIRYAQSMSLAGS